MRIGIDGRWLFRGNPSGRTVVRNLLQQLVARHAENEYFVFLSGRDRNRLFPFPSDRVHLEYMAHASGLLSNCLLFPWRARRLRLEAGIFQYFAPLHSRFRRVVYIHDAIFKDYPRFFPVKERLYFLPMKFLARRAHLIITVSQSERRRLQSLGFSCRGGIGVVANGVNPAFRPAPAHDPKELRRVTARYSLPERFLLYVGRMDIRKNIPGLLRAFAQLRETDAQLVLAGAGDPAKLGLEAIARGLGIGEKVRFIGWVDDPDLPLLFVQASAFIYPSFVEGFGLPPLEALASGIPVVVSDIDVMREVCGDAAVYVDPRDPAAMAAGLAQVLNDQSLRRELRARGLAQAAKFTWERSVDTLLGFIAAQGEKP